MSTEGAAGVNMSATAVPEGSLPKRGGPGRARGIGHPRAVALQKGAAQRRSAHAGQPVPSHTGEAAPFKSKRDPLPRIRLGNTRMFGGGFP